MSQEIHEHAKKLLAQERVEGISTPEREWLVVHLRECLPCTEFAHRTEAALRSLRAMPVPFPSGLASRTQFRVQLRAQELREREPRRRAIWIACGMSWVLGVASAPFVWRGFEWIGQHTGAPKLLWESGFVLWWTLPALVATVILLLENAGQSSGRAWMQRRN